MASDQTLLPSLRRRVAEVVSTAGFGRKDFEFDDYTIKGVEYTSLVYVPEPSYHLDFYARSPSPWHIEYAPGRETMEASADEDGWPGVERNIVSWLDALKREIGVGDPWSVVVDSVESFNLGGDGGIDNRPFDAVEQNEILARLDELRRLLLESGRVAEEDRHLVVDRLNHLDDSVKLLGRFDWRGSAFNVLVELAILGYVERDEIRHVVDFFVGAVQQLLAN